MSVANILKMHPAPKADTHTPLWEGPESGGNQGGITQSLLGRFLSCRERFRLLVVEGLKPVDSWHARTGYGDMWHLCEQEHAKDSGRWSIELMEHCKRLCQRYQAQVEEINKWYQCCKTQFPIYVKYWGSHPDVIDRVPMFQEQEFRTPYELPSGRIIYLRGKWDSVDLIGKGNNVGVFLKENKTKGEVDQVQITRQLRFDLQTMLYLVALKESIGQIDPKWQRYINKIRGVCYNVVRRPLSGGKGQVTKHKPTKSNPQGESERDFWARVGRIIEGTEKDSKGILYPGPASYFMRWQVEVSQADIDKFKQQCLDPILENLCWWWNEINGKNVNRSPLEWKRLSPPAHWRTPYGAYDPLVAGTPTEYDAMIDQGSEVGLERTTNLFPELSS